MALVNKTYGKDRVRVMRIDRKPDRHEVREVTVRAMLTGRFDGAFTATALESDESQYAVTGGVLIPISSAEP